MVPVATRVADDGNIVPPRYYRKTEEFDRVVAPPDSRTTVRRAVTEDIGPLLSAARTAIGAELASEAVVKRVAAGHPDAVWIFARQGQVVGTFAMLMLNDAGLEALLSDTINFRDPAPSLLAGAFEAPAGIYVWGVLAPPLAAEGITKVIVRLQSPPYERANIYAFQTTEKGARLQQRLGFQPVPGHPRGLFQYVRLPNRPH